MNNKTLKQYTEIVKSVRTNLNINQKEYATRLGVSQSMVSKMEAGVLIGDVSTLIKMFRLASPSLKLTFVEWFKSAKA